MNSFINFISDIRVVIAIAIIVVILVIWLIVHSMRSDRLKRELEELESRYTQMKNVPVSLKLNKAVAISKTGRESTDKLQDCQTTFDSVQGDMNKISSDLADAEDLIVSGKHSKADALMNDIESEIKVTDVRVRNLERELDGILAKETAQRQEVTRLKNRFRALKSQAQENAATLSYAWPIVEQKVTDTERMFSTFEEWMFSNDFDKANQELVSIRTNIDELDNMVVEMPKLIQDCTGVIPQMAKALQQEYNTARRKGVYLKHLEAEKNVAVINAGLKEDIKKIRTGNFDGIRDNIDDYKKRLNQLSHQIKRESVAYAQLQTLAVETEELVQDTNNTAEFIKLNYDKVSYRFGLSGLNDRIETLQNDLVKLNERSPEVLAAVYEQKPATAVVSSLKELNGEYNAINKELTDVRTQITNATGDEDRAQKQLIKLQVIMNQMQVKIRKYKLPKISSAYEEDMIKANSYIHTLETLMNENPLNIQLMNSTLSEALNFIYQLYNNVNNIVGTVVMVENTIVFGNRYRSTYSDIDSELTRSELCFRNGEYTQALTIAIATIEKIHPGNYESMIKENAKSAA